MRATLLGVIGLIFVATTAQGQLVGLNELWNVPGVINDVHGTVVVCTNRTTSSATIGVDMYNAAGGYTSGGSITTAPDATVMFATGAYPNLDVDVVLSPVAFVAKGHARIYSSAKSGILCSAMLVNSVNGQALANLTIAKKTKQKGD